MPRSKPRRLAIVFLLVAPAVLLVPACTQKGAPRKKAPPPVPFTGPAYLRGTIGAMARFNDLEPLLVSGYGMVSELPGTGSEVVPPVLRQRMLLMARKGGLGSARLGMQGLTPERFLASRDTAVVAVEGLIPAGATKGAPFDLLVTVVPQTQVEGLAGGRLWTTDLSVLGLDATMDNRPLAQGRGPLYVNPFDLADDQSDAIQAVVVAGGIVGRDRALSLTLFDPSYGRARLITDRINERFPRAAGPPDTADREDVAVARSPSTIQINIPRRAARNPGHLMNLILHLYVQAGPEFEVQRAGQLAEVLLAQPDQTAAVVAAWEALGRRAKITLRQYYGHEASHLRLASLEAGARLGDDQASAPLSELADDADPAVRVRVAGLLRFLPRSIPGARTLQRLLNDPERGVRLAAYESLAAIGDASVQRVAFVDDLGPKFLLHLVDAERPLVYIAQSPAPRVVIFNPMLGFKPERLVSLWSNRLMLRRDGPHAMTVFYQERDKPSAVEQQIRPAVANLVYLMGHRSTVEHPMEGLNLQFAQVAGALYALCRRGAIEADIELQVNPSAVALARARGRTSDGMRPEFSALDDLPGPPADQ